MVVLGSDERRHWLTLQQPVTGQDAAGQPLTGYVTVITVRGGARPIGVRDVPAADGQYAEATVRFRVRWRRGVQPTWRVLWRGVAHEVVGQPIDVMGQGVALDLMCKALA